MEGSSARRIRTADSRFLVFLKVIVHEAEDKRGLEIKVKRY